MVNYQNGKIYKLVNNTTTDVYYGATCSRLSDRLSEHKSVFKKGKYMTSRKIFEGGDVSIILVETYPCDSKDELTARERFWI